MNMKRTAVLGAAALVIATTLAACSGGDDTSSSSGGGGASGDQVTIQVFDSYAPEEPHGQYIYEYADAFMAENPDITVEITAVPSNDVFTKLAAMASDPSSLPTLYFTSGDQAPSLYSLGFTEDLTKYIDDDKLATFAPGVIEAARLGEAISFYPVAVQPLGILYRTDRFSEAQVEPPTTWDEFIEVSKKLTSGEKAGFGMIGSNNSSGQSRFMSYLWSNCLDVISQNDDGTWVTDVDTPEFFSAFSKWTDMANVDKIVPTGITSIDYPTAANYFAMGMVDTMMTGGNALGVAYSANEELKGNIGSFVIPGECPGSQINAEGYAMSAHAADEQKEAALKYLDFIANNDPELMFWQSSGKIPATVAGQAAEFLQGKDYAGLLETLELGTVPTVNFAGLAAVKSALGDAYSAVFSGEATNEEAVEALKKKIDQILQEEN